MCRLLAVKSPIPIDMREHLRSFTRIAQNSKEYQGHGWGCAWRTEDNQWDVYRNVNPIWEDTPPEVPKTNLLLAHARSAYRNEGVVVENNMPFLDDDGLAFIFNGELHGVRIREDGRIGAEKIFNFIRRFADRGIEEALQKGADIIAKRSEYVRAMNIIISDGERIHLSSMFNEDPTYFTMYHRAGGLGDFIICSEPLAGFDGWTPIANGEVRTFP